MEQIRNSLNMIQEIPSSKEFISDKIESNLIKDNFDLGVIIGSLLTTGGFLIGLLVFHL
jgi:hypothetical protein